MESSNHLTKSGGEASGKGWAMGKSKQGGEKAWHTTSQAAGETEAQSRVTWPHLKLQKQAEPRTSGSSQPQFQKTQTADPEQSLS